MACVVDWLYLESRPADHVLHVEYFVVDLSHVRELLYFAQEVIDFGRSAVL